MPMGSFFGHAFPGIAFLVVGMWWMFRILMRFYTPTPRSDLQKPDPTEPRLLKTQVHTFRSSVTYPVTTRCGTVVDIEGWVVFVFVLLGVLFELVIVNPSGQQTITPVNLQHATMYLAFGAAFLSVPLLPCLRVIPHPQAFSFLLLSQAFLVQWLLFRFHVSEVGAVHGLMHRLLRLPVLGGALVTLAEVLYGSSVLLALARPYCSLLVGLWLWQVGLTLYPPTTNFWGKQELVFQHEHATLMTQTCVFVLYAIGLFVFMVMCWAGVGAYYSRQEIHREPGNQAKRIEAGNQAKQTAAAEELQYKVEQTGGKQELPHHYKPIVNTEEDEM